MLVYFLVFVYSLFTYSGHCLPSISPAPLKHNEIFRRTSPSPPDRISERQNPSRTLQLIIDVVEKIAPVTLIENGVTYEVMSAHGFLYFGGMQGNGPYRLEVCIVKDLEGIASNDRGLVLQGFDYTIANQDRLVSQYPGRIVVDLPDTTILNDAIIDPATGGGLAAETLAQDPEYRIGPEYNGRINDCFTYVERFLKNIGAEFSPEVQRIFATTPLWYKTWTPAEAAKYSQAIKIQEIVRAVVTGESSKSLNVFSAVKAGESACEGKTKRDGSCTLPSDTKEENVFALDPNDSDLPANMLALDPVKDLAASSALAATNDIETKVTIARAGGVLKSFVTVGQEVLQKLGVGLQDLLGPAFVILEFIGKDWKMAAIGAVNTAAAIAAGFAPEGPVGWIIDAAVFILFSILPGLLPTNPPALITDVQGIIQWTFFNNVTHTGNEQCQEGSPGIPGNPNCQVLYGAGTLAKALSLTNFATIAFLWQFNQGYAMTIPDIAAAFYVINPTIPGDGSDKVATINCRNSQGTSGGRAGKVGAQDPNHCWNPEYLINLSLIYLTTIGETADKVETRIIPAPGGDCELVAYPGSLYFASFNITLSGLPSGILCNINADSPVGGTIVAPGSVSVSSASSASSASAVPSSTSCASNPNIPPETPFTALSPRDYTCLSYGSTSLCLPPGTYSKQSGLGFEIKDVTTLHFPPTPGTWNLTIDFELPWIPHGRTTYGSVSYSSDQTPPASSATFYAFADDMQAIDTDTGTAANFTITSPNDDTGPNPVCCLFTETSFAGDAWCAGPGIGDLPSQWQEQAESVNCYSGALMRISANTYDCWDLSAPEVGTLDDLSQQPYGGQRANYAQNVKAVWIYPS